MQVVGDGGARRGCWHQRDCRLCLARAAGVHRGNRRGSSIIGVKSKQSFAHQDPAATQLGRIARSRPSIRLSLVSTIAYCRCLETPRMFAARGPNPRAANIPARAPNAGLPSARDPCTPAAPVLCPRSRSGQRTPGTRNLNHKSLRAPVVVGVFATQTNVFCLVPTLCFPGRTHASQVVSLPVHHPWNSNYATCLGNFVCFYLFNLYVPQRQR